MWYLDPHSFQPVFQIIGRPCEIHIQVILGFRNDLMLLINLARGLPPETVFLWNQVPAGWASERYLR